MKCHGQAPEYHEPEEMLPGERKGIICCQTCKTSIETPEFELGPEPNSKGGDEVESVATPIATLPPASSSSGSEPGDEKCPGCGSTKDNPLPPTDGPVFGTCTYPFHDVGSEPEFNACLTCSRKHNPLLACYISPPRKAPEPTRESFRDAMAHPKPPTREGAGSEPAPPSCDECSSTEAIWMYLGQTTRQLCLHCIIETISPERPAKASPEPPTDFSGQDWEDFDEWFAKELPQIENEDERQGMRNAYAKMLKLKLRPKLGSEPHPFQRRRFPDRYDQPVERTASGPASIACDHNNKAHGHSCPDCGKGDIGGGHTEPQSGCSGCWSEPDQESDGGDT